MVQTILNHGLWECSASCNWLVAQLVDSRGNHRDRIEVEFRKIIWPHDRLILKANEIHLCSQRDLNLIWPASYLMTIAILLSRLGYCCIIQMLANWDWYHYFRDLSQENEEKRANPGEIRVKNFAMWKTSKIFSVKYNYMLKLEGCRRHANQL